MAKKDTTIYWLVLGVAAAALAVGGTVVTIKITSERKRLRQLLRDASERWGLDPDWLDAIGYVESRWNSQATNMTGSDLARGGAIGMTQITMKTAQAHGYKGTWQDLLASPETQADLSAQILAAGDPQSIEDAAAWWNAGKKRASQLSATHVTRVDYIPKAQAALSIVQQEGFAAYVPHLGAGPLPLAELPPATLVRLVA